MSHARIRKPPRAAVVSARTATDWNGADDLRLDDALPHAAVEAGDDADADTRQLIARRRLERYLEQKRLRDVLREVFQDDDQ